MKEQYQSDLKNFLDNYEMILIDEDYPEWEENPWGIYNDPALYRAIDIVSEKQGIDLAYAVEWGLELVDRMIAEISAAYVSPKTSFQEWRSRWINYGCFHKMG